MTIRKVGPNSTYPSIAAAVAAAAAGDIIVLEHVPLRYGYSNERAVLTVQDLTVQGRVPSYNIDLVLGAGINNVTLGGDAEIEVWDNAGSNVITGNDTANRLHVSGGADLVNGGDGIDSLLVKYGAATSVVITAGSVSDNAGNSVSFEAVEGVYVFTGSGDESVAIDGDYQLYTRGGNDTIAVGPSSGIIQAGAGNDTVTSGDFGSWVYTGPGDDIVTGGSGRNLVYGGKGDDILQTFGGDDSLGSNGGIDTVEAGVGDDDLWVDYARLQTDVNFSISAGSVARGYSGMVADATGQHSVSFTGVERFDIRGGRGDDDLRLGGGDDAVYGGGGADTLSGGQGRDYLEGGTGSDIFLFDDLDSRPGSADEIDDLQRRDTIDLSRIDADVTVDGDQAFVLVERFSGAAGQAVLSLHTYGYSTRLALDTDGDSVADIEIIAWGDHREFDNFVL